MMTSRPLFPGKSELDQIARIHDLPGTPPHDVLAEFGRNPNQQIGFSFPPRTGVDMATLLPFCTRETVALLVELLAYNPIDRITAANALEHLAFGEIRAMDTAKAVPIPVFARSGPPARSEMAAYVATAMRRPRGGEAVRVTGKEKAKQRLLEFRKLVFPVRRGRRPDHA
jgi:serine/threonine protein kinase